MHGNVIYATNTLEVLLLSIADLVILMPVQDVMLDFKIFQKLNIICLK
jgi:hypothetical protein